MIVTRTPFRVSLMGGGTDYPAWYREHGGAVLVSTVDKYCTITAHRPPPFVGEGIRLVYSSVEHVRSVGELRHPAVRAVLRHAGIESGIEIHSDGDLPARSGMGSSSAFTVGLLHAVYALQERPVSPHRLALDAIELEQMVMQEAVGSQDQVAAAYGGLNHVEFRPDGRIRVTPVAASPARVQALADHLLLFFTGIARPAAVARSVVEGLGDRAAALRRLRALVEEARAVVEGAGGLTPLGAMLDEAWGLKRSLSPLVSTPTVDALYRRARAAGALGGKLLGAGGGGFLLLFAEPDRQAAVVAALSPLVRVPFRFESAGSRLIFADRGSPPPRGRAAPRAAAPGPDTRTELYRRMRLIRKVELRIEAEYPKDEMVTPVHLCIGQEAVAVGACAALRREDYVSSNFRGHGHYLAKGGSLHAMMAELYGRATGCARGFGGSMHLLDPAVGLLGSSAIVAGGIPIGVGLALAARMQRQDRVSLIFFGDGAVDEGVFYESVNFAVLRGLPAIFVLENNQWSICSPVRSRQVGPTVFHRADPAHLWTAQVDGNDVLDVRAAVSRAVDRARAGGGPSLVECLTYRVRQHVGAGSDTHLGHRSAEEVAAWEARCPVAGFRERLLREGALDRAALDRIDREIDAEIDEAVAFARSSPLPADGDLPRYVFRD
jgi:TPP-dependent pyruvate/acetoin dehydrogenase alpha subunit/galactokinase/mevalonate kinase-like predicted kinase